MMFPGEPRVINGACSESRFHLVVYFGVAMFSRNRRRIGKKKSVVAAADLKFLDGPLAIVDH